MLVVKSPIVLTVLLMMFALPASRAQDGDVQPTLRYSCLNYEQFLSIAVSTPERDGFPDVRLMLTDPNGRTMGFQAGDHAMPESRYARVVEIPPNPHRSRAIAAESCKPTQGRYKLVVEEHAESRYRLSITGEGQATAVSVPLHLVARASRRRYYEFNYYVSRDGKAVVELLNQAGKPMSVTERVELNEW